MSGRSDSNGMQLTSRSGMSLEISSNGSLRRFACNGILVNLYVGNEVEGGPANVYLRRHSNRIESTPLLGPLSATRFHVDEAGGRLVGSGSWQGIDYVIELAPAQSTTAWFWHVRLENTTSSAQEIDLTYAQDLALAPYGAVRLNEYYVSQYIDHTPLSHPVQGIVLASRQNQAADGRHPWSLIGSLRKGTSFATDALQFHGLTARVGDSPAGLTGDLPGRRLQHEHSMVVVRDAPIRLDPRATVSGGFFGVFVDDHPAATRDSDLDRVTEVLAVTEATPRKSSPPAGATPKASTLFSSAPPLQTMELDEEALQQLFPAPWRHEERDEHGRLLSFFYGSDRHVVLRAKELQVTRPHGHMLRTGRHLTPDESALTSTVWMSGVFHSMLTQGHVSINRLLSTVHSYLGLFRSHGQRVFMESHGGWKLLNVPSAFEMAPDECRWIYRHEGGEVHVRAQARSEPHELSLSIEVMAGEPARFLISHHVALNGDDGSTPGPAQFARDGKAIVVTPVSEGEIAQRFPQGRFEISPTGDTDFAQVGGDELLFLDGKSRHEAFVCVITAPSRSTGLSIRGQLIDEATQTPLCVEHGQRPIPEVNVRTAASSGLAEPAARLAEIVPWFTHNALVHYLSPRGLEQYSGGGWGTRDVCQGPVEMLLALNRVDPIRDLLLRVMRTQNADGDWPQWFMFFERERHIRPGDSHGDIVFWPLVVLGQYLTASGDSSILDEWVPFFDPRGPEAGEPVTVWQHAERALSVIEQRVISGTALAAYGHGDWNDSLQPADPSMREHMCSAWTVTLHYQTLRTLAQALREVGRTSEAARLEGSAERVRQDFERLLLVDGVLTGYALFEQNGGVRYLLHPRDATTGVHYSSLAMIHAILEDLLTPTQAREHLDVIEKHLLGPDGIRLFDRPMPYHGGPQRFFQRAESATFFGREIGLMYMHAHLRYAQALAHMGEADRFFKALCQANPIGLPSIVPPATLRQANCYYSSSDAAFDDRYQASAEYERVSRGAVPLDGGWRVYSSGAGIALGLIMRHFFGLSSEARVLSVDPVIPRALDGLCVDTTLLGHPAEVQYRIGRAGCGVNAVALNGAALPFTRRDNPHRPGAALVPKTEVISRLTAHRNSLIIDIA